MLILLPFQIFSQSNLITSDSAWVSAVEYGINTFISLNHAINDSISLEKWRVKNDSNLREYLNSLDSIYRLEIFAFKKWFSENNIKRRIGPNAYLDTALELEKLFFLPDVFAMIINGARNGTNPRIGTERKKTAEELITKISYSIDTIEHSPDFELEFQSYLTKTKNLRARIFQGSLSQNERLKYRRIDYLLLKNRINN